MGRFAVVTGAGAGLGLCIVKKHLSLGDDVYALDKKPTPELERLAESYGQALRVQKCDIGDTASVKRALKPLLDEGRGPDIVYNAAGIFTAGTWCDGLLDTDLDAGHEMFNINAVGALRVCKALWPLIDGAVVANISSEAGSVGACQRTGEYLYCMSKAAMNMGSKILSNQLAERGVRVLCFHPGWLRTAMGGERAANSPYSIEPEESAEKIVGIVLRADEIPEMYMEYNGKPLPW